MKRKLICLLIAGCLPGLAAAETASDKKIKILEAQLQALQKTVKELQTEVHAQHQVGTAVAAAPVAVDPSSPNYGSAPASISNDDLDSLKQQVASQQLKVDTLTTAAQTGPLAGLSVTGYIDPTYIYNRDVGNTGFLFANHNTDYTYYNSTFGDLYLDIKKTFGVGPMAPSAEVTLMPNRGNGITLLQDQRGAYSASDILNTAVVTVPLTATNTLVAGLMPSFGGYEVQQSNQMNTLTHGLLYDFSDPGSYIGIGDNYAPDGSKWAFKFMLANEQYRTYGSVITTGVNANTGQTTTTSNKIPTFTARADYTWSSALDLGGSINIGRQSLSQGVYGNGNVVYGPVGLSTHPAGTFLFGELDASYILADTTYNAELDYGQADHAAYNGNQAQWYGLSLLAHRKFNVPGIGRMGATVRYDILANSKNGGGGGGIVVDDGVNGFGPDLTCIANSSTGGTECKGATRQEASLDLLFYPTQQITVKVEYRHDWSNKYTFVRSNGSFSKTNDIIGTQFIYTF